MKFFIISLLYFLSVSLTYATDNTKSAPALMLANVYHAGINLQEYWVSEKLDGVRAYWNGRHLVSRQGNIFSAPEWFIAPLPKIALDGELWIGRGKFDQLSGRARQ